MERRTFVTAGLAALGGLSVPGLALAASKAAVPPDRIGDTVRELARGLARRRFEAPAERLPNALKALDYDAYRTIRFRPEKAVWHDEDLGFELQFFPSSYIYRSPVSIFIVDGRRVQRLTADTSMFDFGPVADRIPRGAPLGFSGFRIHGPINRRDRYDEFLVFQGASYFRGLGKNHQYGLSARALSINTTGAEPEEFPSFRSFWIERPDSPEAIRVHGLLDSPSVAGAYTFVIRPGPETTMDVSSVLYPRRDLNNVGVAPLTSMFLKTAHDVDGPLDFRPSVHDSDGLAAWNSQDERLWRPLLSPATLQVSSFRDKDPKGFGLVQRERRFEEYQDLEARYELRPSAWVAPAKEWGAGGVELVEIPTDVEYADNIVAYWRPDATLRAGGAYAFSYRLGWCDDVPTSHRMRIDKTRIGAGSLPGTLRFVVDFADKRPIERVAGNSAILSDVAPIEMLEPQLSSSAGTLKGPYLQSNPFTPGTRVVFELDPGKAKVIELRLSLASQDETASEVWLYRWTA